MYLWVILFVISCFQVYLGASFLLFLQRDHIILKSHSKENNLTPTLCTLYCFLILATCYYSNYWTAKHWWYALLGMVEMLLCIATLPNVYVLTTVLWSQCFYISDRCVVFVTPLYAVLMLAGSSYTAWLLGSVGLLSGWWLMSEKLPLDR